MGKTILFKRGTVANLPNLQEGEPGWSTDTKALYVGDGDGAPVKIGTETSDFAATIMDDADAAAVLTTLGLDTDLPTFSVPANTTISTFGKSIVDDASAAAVIATLGLDADIATFAVPANTTISAFGATLVDDATKIAAKATLGIPITYVDDYAVGDGTTDDTAAIESAISAATAGGILFFGPKTYKITDDLAVGKALTIRGSGITSRINQATGGKAALTCTVSNIDIKGLYLTGVGHSTYNAAEIGINAYGASYAAAISNIKIQECFFANWGAGAVQLTYVTDFIVNKNKVDGVVYYGVQTISAVNGDISENKIDDVPGSADTSWDAYGIAMTRNQVDSLVTDPRSSRITVTKNRISNIPTWEGIDTHAGSDITIEGNIINGCKNGIMVGPCKDASSAQPKYAPYKVAVIGNRVDSGVSDGSMGVGITLCGAFYSTVQEYATDCVVAENTIIGHGDQTNALSGALRHYATKGLILGNNTIRQCSPSGINLEFSNFYCCVNGGTIIDIFTNTTALGAVYGINVDDGSNTFIISDVYARADTSAGTYQLSTASGVAVRVANATGNAGKLGLVDGNATTLLSDAGGKVSKNLNA